MRRRSARNPLMTVKTQFTPDDFTSILSRYRLGELVKFEPLVTGTVQTNFLLKTTRGVFVLRYYENRSKKSVRFESSLLVYLHRNRYPCPAQFKNTDNVFVSMYKRKPLVIFEFVAGEHIRNPNDAQKKQVVQKVAELHHLTEGFKPRHIEARLNYTIENCRNLAYQKVRNVGTLAARSKLKWFEDELRILCLPTSLPKGVCHCDFHFSNILFKNGEFKALIDFDDANYTYLIYDLAALLNPFVRSFQWDTWFNFRKNADIFDFREVRKTVEAYREHRELTRMETEYLFDVFKLSILYDCIWYYERGGVEDFFEKRKIAALNWLGRETFYHLVFCGKMC